MDELLHSVDFSGRIGKIGEDITWAVRQFHKFPFVDTTFQTNKYRRLLLLFTSLDSHGLSMGIGGAILRNSRRQSFERVLRTFRELIGENAASGITVSRFS